MNGTATVNPDAALAGGCNARKFDKGNDWKGEAVEMSAVRAACAANPGTEITKRPHGNRLTRHVLRIDQEIWYDFDVSEKVAQKAAQKASEKAAIKVYDEPGRGRRQCPKCSKYVGIKTATCICGNTEWVAKAETPKVVTAYDTGGLGRKHCPACNKYVGVRVEECPCGHKFVKVAEAVLAPVTVVVKETTETAGLAMSRVSAVPFIHRTGVYDASAISAFRSIHKWDGVVMILETGPVDVKPESLDTDGLREWVQKIVSEGKRIKKKLYTPGALRHMLRTFMGRLTPTQGEEVLRSLDVVFAELKWPLTA